MRNPLVSLRLAACSFTLVAVGVVACSPGKAAQKTPLSQAAVADSVQAVEAAHSLIGPAAKAALDSGNALFRKKAYAAALAAYREASTLAPQHAAPLFGIYMVARATSNTALADSALVGIRQRNGPAPSGSHPFPDSLVKKAHASLRKGQAG